MEPYPSEQNAAGTAPSLYPREEGGGANKLHSTYTKDQDNVAVVLKQGKTDDDLEHMTVAQLRKMIYYYRSQIDSLEYIASQSKQSMHHAYKQLHELEAARESLRYQLASATSRASNGLR